jgi:hypothetical protein
VSGPQRSLTGIIEDIRSQTGEVNSIVYRMRTAGRRLTGTTGEAPTPLTGAGRPPEAEEVPPLMVQLTIGTEKLNQAIAALRAEVSHMENLSETGRSDNQPQGYASQGQVSAAAPWTGAR